jgi:hypothetical protein
MRTSLKKADHDRVAEVRLNVSALEDIAAILDDAQEQISALQPLHDEALDKEAARPRFRARIKSVLEHERSALDYLAVELTKRHGTSKGLIYYPLAQSTQDFSTVMENKMPGVAAAATKVAAAIEKWQPYQPGMEWLRDLNKLTREQKHNRLTLQLVRDTVRCRVTEDATGAFVEWYGLTFRPGPNPGSCMIDSQGGPILIQLEPNRPGSAPKPFWVGVGPTGVEVFGVPIDFATQRPMLDPRLTVESERMSRWFFIIPHQPVMDFLASTEQQIRQAVGEIAQVAGL